MIGDELEDYLKKLSFRGNQNLRPENTVIEYSQDMINELIKCKFDPIYFIKKYVMVIHVDKGLVPLNLFPYQEELVNAYHNNRKVITMQPRQFGKTISTAAYVLHYILFNDKKTTAILANKMLIAREILSRIQMMYESLPRWMQQGVVEWNKGSIKLENGSRIIAQATSASAIRGLSVSLLVLDEFAFLENNLAEDFFTSVFPTLSSGKETKLLISSTPRGYNHFYKFWSEAEKGINGFVPILVKWNQHPDRDEKWYKEQFAVLGELKFNQEVECQFLGSSRQLLSSATMSRLTFDVPVKVYDGQYSGLRIYSNPEKNRSYIMTVDTSRGRHLDYSTFIVFDVTEYPHKMAAVYRNNEVAPLMYAGIVHQIAKNYNDAYTLIETNDIGAQVAESLWYDFEYENVFWTKGDMLGKAGNPYPGLRTTKKTKFIGCANAKDIIDQQQLIINDQELIQEFSTFVQSGNGTYAADEGFHDDLVMCVVLFAWLAMQPWFIDLTDRSARNRMYAQTIKDMESDLAMGGFCDGTDNFQEDTPLSRGFSVQW